MENPGSVLLGWARFRWIRWIRWRVPGGPKNDDSLADLAQFAGKLVPSLSPTLENPKENQQFQLQP